MYSNRFVQTAVHTTARTAIHSAVYGTDFADSLRENLKNAGIDEVAAMGAGEIGDEFASGSMAGGPGSVDYWLHKGSHAALGCATASAKGGDCASGAFGGVAGEVFAEQLGKTGMSDKWLLASSRIATVFSAGAAGKDINDADATASNAVQNNYLKHDEAIEREKARKSCSEGNMESCSRVAELDALDEKTDKEIQAEVAACGTGKSGQDCLRDLYQNKYKSIMDKHMSDFEMADGMNQVKMLLGGYSSFDEYNSKASGNELGDLFKSVFVSPNGVDVDQNMEELPWREPRYEQVSEEFPGRWYNALEEFHDMVRTGGVWDFKKGGQEGQFENFGNFNYGATGADNKLLTDYILRNEAGKVQTNPEPEWGKPNTPIWGIHTERFPINWCDTHSCGDDPVDTEIIEKGIFYRDYIYGKK